MPEEIVLKFSMLDGGVRIEAKGFKGQKCKKATEFLETSLGTMTDFQKKKEWYETNITISGSVNSNLCG